MTKSTWYNSYILPAYLSLFHIAFIILIGFFARYKFENGDAEIPMLYAMFMDVHSMMFVGFGFLMTFLKRYGYGSIGFNFVLAAYVIEWSMLLNGWFSVLSNGNSIFNIDLLSLLDADFCAAAILISFGAVIGKATLSQMIVMVTIEVVLQVVNSYIGGVILLGYDVGDSIYVHVFGAYFGLAVAKVLSIGRETESEKESSNYHSDLFSMIGTLFLWLYWPSFNAATAQYEGQLRAIVNTYLSIVASCICTFIVSLFVNKGKLNMVQVQNATLAGGVAVGAVADMMINPFGAMIVGSVAGLISTLGFQYATPFLNHKFVHDTCGVNNLHGVPGIISGLASAVVAGVASRDDYYGNRLYIFYPSRIPPINSTDYINYGLAATEFAAGGPGRTASQQAGYQLATLSHTLGIAIVGGALTGLVLRLPLFEQITDKERLFDDEAYWKTPSDFEQLIGDEENEQVQQDNEHITNKKRAKKASEIESSPVNGISIKLDTSSLHQVEA